MRDTHAPDSEFVERLHSQIGAEIRRRNRYAELPGPSPVEGPRWTRWLAQSPLKAAVAVAVLILLSMAVGGIVVAAAYQAQTNEQRDVLRQRARQQVDLARLRLDVAANALKLAERQTSTGVEPQDTLLDARFKLAEAQAQLQSAQLDLDEVNASGREPMTTVSAPLVGARDFVAEHWKIDLQIPKAALEAEQTRLQVLQRRVAVGAASNLDAALSRARIVELEVSVSALQTKLDIRERFLTRKIDGPLADLYVLEAEALQRRQTIAPRLELAQKVVRDVQQKVEVGVAAVLDLSQAQLKLKELELDMSKAEVDLGVIRRQIDQRRTGR